MNLNTVATILSQNLLSDKEITGICIDSRAVQPGNVFIALDGERFDGHHFVKDAEAKGAIAAVVTHAIDGVAIPQFVVPDTVNALAAIATAHRQTVHCPIIALTGSNGKTSVKEMIASILPSPSHATFGNLNNHIGAPLSVLQLTPEHNYAVFELGASHSGDIAHTVAIVQPVVTLINNIAPAHVEGFGSIDGVALAKGEIYQGLPKNGIAVVNDDDAYSHFWDDQLANKKIIRFSITHKADVYAENIKIDTSGYAQFTLVLPLGRTEIQLQVPGEHNIRNALAAAACCDAVGISIVDMQRGLNQFSGVKGRLTLLAGKNQSVIIDDTYNANLRSVLTALDVLSRRPGKKIFVFGDMGELGEWANQHHQDVGTAARELGIDKLFCCGTLSVMTAKAFGSGGLHFSTQEDATRQVLEELAPDTTILVKGSRSSAMEKIVAKLLN